MNRILPLLLIAMFAGQADASVFFEIVDVPTVYVAPGEDANFVVSVENGGSESTHAGLKFKNLSEGLAIAGPRCTKWVDSGTTKEFDCQLRIEAGDIPSGRYSFEVGISAAGAPPNWRTVDVVVNGRDSADFADFADFADSRAPTPISEPVEYPACPVRRDVGGEEAPEEESPGFGAILGVMGFAAVLLVARRGGR